MNNSVGGELSRSFHHARFAVAIQYSKKLRRWTRGGGMYERGAFAIRFRAGRQGKEFWIARLTHQHGWRCAENTRCTQGPNVRVA